MRRANNYFFINYLSLSISLFLFITDLYAEIPSQHEWTKASAVVASSLVLLANTHFIPTKECYWCRINNFDLAITRSLSAENLSAARVSSDIFTFGFIPLISLSAVAFFSPNSSSVVRDILVISSSIMATVAITEAIKISARRMRPEVAFGALYGLDDYNRSFLSGHTSFSAALLATATMLAFKNRSPFAKAFATFAALATTGAGISRIAAEKHWATDVLAGMTLGLTVGTIMPFLILDSLTVKKKIKFYLLPDQSGRGVLLGTNF